MTATENKKTEASEATDKRTKLFDTRLFKNKIYEYNEHEIYYEYDPITKERVKKIRIVRRKEIH